MIIYILHNDRYYTFRLPKNPSGNLVLFDYDKNSIKRNLVNVIGNNSKWFIKSNNNARILNGDKYIDAIELRLYSFYMIRTIYNENICLYVSPGNDTSFVGKRIADNNPITVGSDSNCGIVLANNFISPQQFELKKEEGSIVFKTITDTQFLYINGKKYTEKKLNDYDLIFLNGFKFLILADLIFVSNPNSVVHFQSSLMNLELQYGVGNVGNNTNFSDFYDTVDYFAKSPVFRRKSNTLHLPITSPEEKEVKRDGSFIMSVVPSALMSVTSLMGAFFAVQSYQKGQGEKDTLITTLATAVIMIFISVVWPFIERFAESIRRILNNINRSIKYKKYLKEKRNVLEKARNDQKVALQFNNLSIEECQETIVHKTANLFSVNPEQKNFLNVKLGVGRVKMDCEFEYARPDFVKIKDSLLKNVDDLIEDYKYIDDAPYSFSLTNNTAFIYGKNGYDAYLESIVIQLLTFHDYHNLKVIVFTTENTFLSRIRNLNNCWNNDRTMRFFATNIQEAENISSYLVRIFNSRTDEENKDKSIIPHYLIICDNMDLYRNITIINRVLEQKEEKIGFSFMTFAERITDVPTGCSYFVNYQPSEATLFQAEMDEENIMSFRPELASPKINTGKCISLLSNIPIKGNAEANTVLPDKLGFLEMNNVGTVEQLNSINRWKTSQVVNTLGVPIGVDANGNTLILDLHEKAHGPHGLIAGMTGSGKSEFIVTYILSLAVNFSPDEVQFVLIDYKGGGLAGAFENKKTGIKLPHLVGTITNLDKSSMNRTLVSIKSELERRQRVFNEAKEQLNTGTIDIYKYQKLVREGSLSEPMSHLYIICDEFAELKAQQPDFMDELVSAARIGRSLGIHLILATQKPSGVVDDQIWSNSKFKVCCKVQTAEDSNEMIRRDDAAYIKESGRFYLQVGYDEIFIKGQSAYTGTQYVPSETVISNDGTKTDIDFIDNVGNVINTIKAEKEKVVAKEDLGDELGNVLNYLVKCAKEIGFTNKQLWLDNIPTTLYYNNVILKYGIKPVPYYINPIIGEYDDPRNQKQGFVNVDLTSKGNTFVVASPGGGKNTLFSTMIYSIITTHNSDEVNIYILDFGLEKLKIFESAPQVGDIITIEEKNKVKYLLYMLLDEIEKRKQYFSTNGGSFDYCVKNKKTPFPTIVVFINNNDSFRENYSDLYETEYSSILRECNKVGIVFVTNAIAPSSLGYAAENSYSQQIMLKLQDTSDYVIFFSSHIVPSDNPGRGLIKLDNEYEFQTALVFSEDKFNDNVKYVNDQLKTHLKSSAPAIPTVPDFVSRDMFDLTNVDLNRIPLGININTAQKVYYNFDRQISFLYASEYKNLTKYLNFFLEFVSKKYNVIVLNGLEDFELKDFEKVKKYNSSFIKILTVLNEKVEKYNKEQTADKFIIVILGFNNIDSYLEESKAENKDLKSLNDLINSSNNDNFKFVICETDANTNELKNHSFNDNILIDSGIWIGKGYANQNVMSNYYIEFRETNFTAVALENEEVKPIKYIF